jgi:hypothetical protein
MLSHVPTTLAAHSAFVVALVSLVTVHGWPRQPVLVTIGTKLGAGAGFIYKHLQSRNH